MLFERSSLRNLGKEQEDLSQHFRASDLEHGIVSQEATIGNQNTRAASQHTPK